MGRYERTVPPMFARAETAARLLDMSAREFLDLVHCGSLPGPVAHDRWSVAQIEAIMSGKQPKPVADFDL